MKSCFAYIRVSTQKQGEGASLGAQRDAIEYFASRNGITITKWFEEKETAAKAGRPIFTEMIKRLRKHEAEGVVLHKVDRGARLLSEWAKFAELADAGIDVHFATESLDFRSRGGRLTADIQAVIAADYIRNLREETLKGLEGRLKQGIYPFAAPLGYLNTGGGKVKTIDPVKGPLRSLPETMAHLGLITDKGTPYTKSSIEKVLRNPFYAGMIKIRKTGRVYQGVHEPLITQHLYDAVQAVKKGRTVKVHAYHRYLFSGLFRCEWCGTAMIAELQKGHVYYRCHSTDCETKTVREEVIHRALSETLCHAALTDEAIEAITVASEHWLAKIANTNQDHTIAMRLTAVNERLERTTDAYIDRVLSEAEYQNRKERLLKEKARLIEEQNRSVTLPTPTDIQRFLELVKNLALHYEMALPDEKRQIVRLVTSNRSVDRKTVVVEPAEWLTETAHAVSGCLCGRRETRTPNPFGTSS
jgi:site-specific DNA recombinase